MRRPAVAVALFLLVLAGCASVLGYDPVKTVDLPEDAGADASDAADADAGSDDDADAGSDATDADASDTSDADAPDAD